MSEITSGGTVKTTDIIEDSYAYNGLVNMLVDVIKELNRRLWEEHRQNMLLVNTMRDMEEDGDE